MGDPSYLRLVPAASDAVPIDWGKIPKASTKFFLDGWCTSPWTGKKRPLPETIGDFARMVNESKFFGHLEQQRCTLLLDISEFGLARFRHAKSGDHGAGGGLSVGPHFYMVAMDVVWVVLFVPGERDGILGLSPIIPYTKFEESEVEKGTGGKGKNEEGKDKEDESKEADDDEEHDEEDEEEDDFGEVEYEEDTSKLAMREKKIAEEYEPRLCEEVSRWGTVMAVVRKQLAGWDASTLQSNLETAQMTEAIMTLPHDHPAHRALMDDFLAELRRGRA